MLGVKQIVEQYKVSMSTVRNAIREDKLRASPLASKEAGRYLFEKVEVERWMAARPVVMKHLGTPS